MPQSLVQIYLHVVFSKNRQPFLTDAEFRGRVHAYMRALQKSDSPTLLSAASDHVHLLIRLSKTHDLSDSRCEADRPTGSSLNAHTSRISLTTRLRRLLPQSGACRPLQTYIANQGASQTESFRTNFAAYASYDVPIDERYVWIDEQQNAGVQVVDAGLVFPGFASTRALGFGGTPSAFCMRS